MDRRVQRDDAVAEHLGEAGQLLERDHGDALVGEELRRAAAREQLEVEPVQLLRERGDAGLVVDGEERALSCRDQLPDDLGQEPVLDAAWIRACSVSGVSPGEHGHALLPRAPRPVSTPSSTRCTVAAVSATPAASASSTAWAPGNAGSRAGCTLTTLSGNRARNVGRKQVHVARADDETDAVRLEPVGHRLVARVAIGDSRSSGNARGRRSPTASARSRAGAPATFEATAAIGMPASIRACRFVPLPLTRTPTSRRPRPRPRRRRRPRRLADHEVVAPTSAAGITAQ